MQSLTPYLMFNGTSEKAMHFYKDCFDGELGYLGGYGASPMNVDHADKNKIMHVKFWGGSFLWLLIILIRPTILLRPMDQMYILAWDLKRKRRSLETFDELPRGVK